MLTIIQIKRAAAVLLMICFVLPLSRCERATSIAAVKGMVTNASVPAAPAEKPLPSHEDKYAFQNLSFDDPITSVFNLAAFFWPLAFFFVSLQKLSRRAATMLNLLELALCAGSAYMIFGITFFGDLLYGGFLAYFAVGAYALLTLAQILMRFRLAKPASLL